MSVVDARFAGGAIMVVPTTLAFTDTAVVSVNVPGTGEIPMFPHEARALAKALQDAVDAAESSTRELRRDPRVDDHLRGLDDE